MVVVTPGLDPTPQILSFFDGGYTPPQIVAAMHLSAGKVYAVLRQHRPARARAPRTRTSVVPAQVLALHAEKIGAARIADLLQVSRAYVYAILKSQPEPEISE